MKKTQDAPKAKSRSTVAIVTMFFLFAMISFVTNLAAPVGTIWKNSYEWSGMLGNMMNFLAYLFMGIPAGRMLATRGYKKTALIALFVGLTGLLLQYICSLIDGGTGIAALTVYLTGAFICGFSVCILNTVVNPMLNLLGGGGNRGNQLVQMGGSFNSLAGTLTPFLVGMLVGQVTKTTTISDVAPLVLIGMGIFAAAAVVIASVHIDEPKSAPASSARGSHSPWNFRHTVLGVIGIFFYVGMEVGIPAILIFYLSDPAASGITENGLAIGTTVAAVYWLLMLVGRMVSSAISGRVSARAQLTAVSCLGALLVIAAIITGSSATIAVPAYSVEDGFTLQSVPMAALFLVLCGLCTSVMWGAIFNLAVEGLGRYTAQASGIFMMMVVGGGILPWLMEAIARAAGYMTSYWVVVAVMLYLLFYALAGSRNVNTDIPVTDEEQIPDAL